MTAAQPQANSAESIGRRDLLSAAGALFVAAASVGVQAFTGTVTSLDLTTADETALGPYRGPVLTPTRTFAGPTITVVAPTLAENPRLTSPVNLHVVFAPAPDAEIDPESLRVTDLKLWVIDLTSRIRPYLKGREIQASDVRMAPGDHVLRLAIADNKRRRSASEFRFRVT